MPLGLETGVNSGITRGGKLGENRPMNNGQRPRALRFALGIIFGFSILFAAPAWAQQQPQNPPANPPSDQKPAPDAGAQDQSKPAGQGQSQPSDQGQSNPNQKPGTEAGTSNDRLLFALPNFLTLENESNVPPLTAGQKFKVVARSSFDYVEFAWYGALAGVSQAENSEPGYGQGAQGYAKRYGSYFADGTIENFMTSAVFAAAFRQDPRFYQKSQGGFWHRVGYAMSRIFVTRTDAGGQQFNYSEILGSAASAGISTYSYHPRSDRTLANTMKVWGTQVGYDTVTIEIKEFWPDIRKKFSHKQQADLELP